MSSTTPDATPRPARLLRAGWYALPGLLSLAVSTTMLVASFAIVGRDAIYPRVIVGALLVVSVACVIKEILASRRHHLVILDDDGDIEGARGEGVALGRSAWAVALLIAFLPLATYVGFFTAIAVLVLGVLLAMGVKSILTLVITVVAVTGAAYVLFELVFGVRFPDAFLV